METKLSKVKAAYLAGDFRLALRIAAKFQDLGDHKTAIKRAHESFSNGRFYQSLGFDLAALQKAGIDALAIRYDFPPVKS